MTAVPSASNAAAPAALIRLLHLASTLLPVGAFSYSQGLEWAVEAGTVTNREQAEAWIFDCLRWSIGRYEAPLLVAAHSAWNAGDDALADTLNALFLATREASELRAETLQMGYSLLRWCNDTLAVDDGRRQRLRRIESPVYPVVFAAIASAWGLDARSMLTVYLWTWLENQVGAALKAVPLGQTDGQRILLAAGALLEPMVCAAIESAAALPRGGWANQCPGLAIASACHEMQYSRLFRS